MAYFIFVFKEGQQEFLDQCQYLKNIYEQKIILQVG